MIKLTPERIQEIAEETGIGYVASGGGDYGNNLDHVEPFARSIEAEVLRLNGITEQQPDKANSLDELRRQMREVTEAAYKTPGKAVRMPDLVATEGRKFMRGEPSLFDQLPFVEVQQIGADFAEVKPRATGCPDTMDETAQYAVDQKSAAEEKSPPATGPAG